MFENTTRAANLLHCKRTKLLFVIARLGELTKAPPRTAGGMSDNRQGAGVCPGITGNVENIAARQREVIRVRAGEKDSDGVHCEQPCKDERTEDKKRASRMR